MRQRYSLAVAIVGAYLLAGAAVAGLDEGKAAMKRGDFKTAHREFLPLAEQGNIEAQATLGWMYSQGLGVAKDAIAARRWLERAASHDGNQEAARAQHNLGAMYEFGFGVPRDLNKAAYWYSKGAQNGDPSAQSNLGTLYLEGAGVPQDFAKGRYWLTKAAQQADPQAYVNLGRVYFEGMGVPKNWAMSYFFLYMAANHAGREVPHAKENLSILVPKLSAEQLAEGKRLVEEALSQAKR